MISVLELPLHFSVFLSQPQGKAIMLEKKKHQKVAHFGGTEEGNHEKQSPGLSGGLEKELPLFKKPTPMHSSAKSPGLPGESQDERLNSYTDGGLLAGAAPNTH